MEINILLTPRRELVMVDHTEMGHILRYIRLASELPAHDSVEWDPAAEQGLDQAVDVAARRVREPEFNHRARVRDE